MNKPPIGANPYWFAYNQRMRELSGAVGRYLEYVAENRRAINSANCYVQIADWCDEIKSLAMLESILERKESEAKDEN